VSSLLWTALGFLGGGLLFLLTLLKPLLQKDLEEGVPWFIAWLVRRAVRKFPAEHQPRFEEEWLAELSAIPGVMVFKLRFALAVSLRARATSRAMQSAPPWWAEILRRLATAIARAFGASPRFDEASPRFVKIVGRQRFRSQSPFVPRDAKFYVKPATPLGYFFRGLVDAMERFGFRRVRTWESWWLVRRDRRRARSMPIDHGSFVHRVEFKPGEQWMTIKDSTACNQALRYTLDYFVLNSSEVMDATEDHE
jgi:hypothetical protein